MASYLKREISEWNTSDLTKWLIDNKYPGISELCQNNSLSGYDLFYITDDILKNELGLNSFHERQVTMKLIKKLIYEHLKLNVINSNGDNVILTLDNNQNTSLGELSEYIGGMFNINPKDILYKDTSKTEVLSPSIKIVELLILYPRLYKTLNVFNMKDYHQNENDNNNEINENMESKENEYNVNSNTIKDEFRRSNVSNNNNIKNKNAKMNFDYNVERNDVNDNFNNDMKNKDIIYEKKYYNENNNLNNINNLNKNSQNENIDDNYNDDMRKNKKLKYYEEYNKQNDIDNKGYNSYRNKKHMNFNSLGVKPYQDNYNKKY